MTGAGTLPNGCQPTTTGGSRTVDGRNSGAVRAPTRRGAVEHVAACQSPGSTPLRRHAGVFALVASVWPAAPITTTAGARDPQHLHDGVNRQAASAARSPAVAGLVLSWRRHQCSPNRCGGGTPHHHGRHPLTPHWRQSFRPQCSLPAGANRRGPPQRQRHHRRGATARPSGPAAFPTSRRPPLPVPHHCGRDARRRNTKLALAAAVAPSSPWRQSSPNASMGRGVRHRDGCRWLLSAVAAVVLVLAAAAAAGARGAAVGG